MDIKEVPPVEAPPRRATRGWLVAAGAFVAVVVIIGAAALLSRPDDGTPPATTPPTTPPTTQASSPTTSTTSTPALDTSAVSYVEALVTELNAGDHQAAAERLASAQEFVGEYPVGDTFDDRTRWFVEFAVWVELDSELTVDSCRTSTNGSTRCEISRLSAHESFYPEPERSVLQVRLGNGGRLAYASWKRDQTARFWLTKQAFIDWLIENHPVDVVTIDFPTDAAAAADAMRRLVPEWKAEQG